MSISSENAKLDSLNRASETRWVLSDLWNNLNQNNCIYWEAWTS
jgi:hypothetical protein